MKDLLDKIYKTIKPYVYIKALNSKMLAMLAKEKVELVSHKKQLGSIMNKLFINIIKSLDLNEDQGSYHVTLKNILKKCLFYPSIG